MLQRQNRPRAKPRKKAFKYGKQLLYRADCLEWLASARTNSISAVVTDPPYSLIEYNPEHQRKLQTGRGGVWRLPPSFDGYERRPLPRFTVLSGTDRNNVFAFFVTWGTALMRVLRPGAHVVIASNTVMSPLVARAMEQAGFERRGEIARLVRTFRGGDRPKGAEEEFEDLCTTPRSCWEPWGVYRKPIQCRTVAENLRKWGVGALRRLRDGRPLLDVVQSGLTPDEERDIAPHPSIKPQHFLRQIVRALMPARRGILLDTFAGAGSTLAACEHQKISSIGIEIDQRYYAMAVESIPVLAELKATGIHRIQTFLPGL